MKCKFASVKNEREIKNVLTWRRKGKDYYEAVCVVYSQQKKNYLHYEIQNAYYYFYAVSVIGIPDFILFFMLFQR